LGAWANDDVSETILYTVLLCFCDISVADQPEANPALTAPQRALEPKSFPARPPIVLTASPQRTRAKCAGCLDRLDSVGLAVRPEQGLLDEDDFERIFNALLKYEGGSEYLRLLREHTNDLEADDRKRVSKIVDRVLPSEQQR
jgi:hypothetical protein